MRAARGRHALRSLRVLTLAAAIALPGVVSAQTSPTALSGDFTPPPLVSGLRSSGPVRISETADAGELLVPLNKSQVLEIDRAFAEVSIGNSEIADVVPLSTRSLYVFGKQLGSTSLTITDRRGRPMAVLDLVVSYDLDGLKAQLFELIPGETIEVRPANDGLVLSGRVSSATRMQRALAVALRYAPEKVTNLIEVTGTQQVMLAVRFAEVARTAIKEIGFRNNHQFRAGSLVGNAVIGDAPGIDPLNFGTATLGLVGDNFNLLATIDALEERGVVKTLAEPNLIALSGDTARFLAGGEFPIPVGRENVGEGVRITIEFKEFGISLSFTPTVVSDELINLELFTEVSDIDPDTSIVFDDLIIPGLEVRRAKTTVELGDGQSFAIAGLLRDEFEDNIRKFPFLGDLPLLGALFRSTGYQLDQTELVVIVTPYLVTPAPLHALTAPTDLFVAPSEQELYLYGKTSGERSTTEQPPNLVRERAGGIVGPHGYILR